MGNRRFDGFRDGQLMSRNRSIIKSIRREYEEREEYKREEVVWRSCGELNSPPWGVVFRS